MSNTDNNNYILGTAGHVDHGKTQLVKALSGTNTDRLKEEQKRGISIKLGFANITLDEYNIGIIDVPGHEKFIREMVTGAFGMDIILLVISAEEGLMPQTKEHLEIIKLLNIDNIIIVLTKIDLVDSDWKNDIVSEIDDYLDSLNLNFPIIEVDSVSNKGIPLLKETIKTNLDKKETKHNESKVKLPIDRAFSIKGHGSIVTGTLWSGNINTGDYLYIYPQKKKVKIRSIENHGNSVETAFPSQRIALNISDLKVNEIEKGSFITDDDNFEYTYKAIGTFRSTSFIKSIKNNINIYVYIGNSEIKGKLILIESDSIENNKEELAGIYFEEETYIENNDILIVRDGSKTTTLGALKIIDKYPPKIKRKNIDFINTYLNKIHNANSEENLVSEINQYLQKNIYINEKNLKKYFDLNISSFENLSNDFMINREENIILNENILLNKENEIEKYIENKNIENSYLRSIGKEEIKQKLFNNMDKRLFNIVLSYLSFKNIEIFENQIYLKDFKYSDEQLKKIETIYNFIYNYNIEFVEKHNLLKEISGLNNISEDNLNEILTYLEKNQKIVKIGHNAYLATSNLNNAIDTITDFIKKNDQIKLSEARDLFNTSRKYILVILEYLDNNNITERQENIRILKEV